MTIARLIWLCCIACLLPFAAQANNSPDPDWKFIKEDGRRGIKMYSRQYDGFRLRHFKVVAELDTKLHNLMALFQDFPAMTKWAYKCRKVEVLKRYNDQDYLLRMEYQAPFGFTDRDAVLRGRVWQDPKTRVISMQVRSQPDAYPEQDGFVRMPVQDLQWSFKPVAPEKVELVLTGIADPGGRIPAWVANLVQFDAPYNSIRGLARIVRSSDYDGARLPVEVLEFAPQ